MTPDCGFNGEMLLSRGLLFLIQCIGSVSSWWRKYTKVMMNCFLFNLSKLAAQNKQNVLLNSRILIPLTSDWLRCVVWNGSLSGVCFPLVIHGGPLEEQEPSGAWVGGPVLLPGRAQRLRCGTGRAELEEEPLRCRGRLWVHSFWIYIPEELHNEIIFPNKINQSKYY